MQQQLVIAGYTSGNVRNAGQASIAQRALDARRLSNEVAQYCAPLPTMRAFIHGYDDIQQLQAQELEAMEGSIPNMIGDSISRLGGHDIDDRLLAGRVMQGAGGVFAIGAMAYGSRGRNIPVQNAEMPLPEAPSAASAVGLRNQLTAEEIAAGHAFDKHVLGVNASTTIGNEFAGLGIRTRQQLQSHIEGVLSNPTSTGELRNGRSYFYDQGTQTIVIRNPRSPDGGTIFRIDTNRYSDPMDYIKGLR